VTAAEPHHEVVDVRHRPGELSFVARIGGQEKRVRLSADADRQTSAEAILPACLMPAMRFGGTLELPVPISPRVLRNQREYQAAQRAWSVTWPFGDPPLREVEVRARAARPEAGSGNGRVAAFFSGGVDSWSTVLDHPELTDLIFVRGVDLRVDDPHPVELIDEVEARMREVAGELELSVHVVDTNLREMSDPLAQWGTYFVCAVIMVAHFLAPRFERVLIATDSDHEVQDLLGSARKVNELWSTERLEIVEDGGRHSRVERTARIATHPIVQRSLRVCWENLGAAYNCGRCRKCLMTMLTLEALGLRERVTTFPPELDLDAIAGIEITYSPLLTLWEDVLDAVREAGRADLEPSVEAAVERGKRRLGLPPEYRRRRRPGPAPLRPRAAAAPPPRSVPIDVLDAEARQTIEMVVGSRSWKLTALLRRLSARAAAGRRSG
jgi:hypothetical protein